MRMPLDSATLLWVSSDDRRLTPVARAAYMVPENDRFVSVVSLWEIQVKHRLGKLPLPAPLWEMLEPMKKSGALRILPLAESAVMQLPRLPLIHRDPFDRMLICQALDQGLTLVTPDATVRRYPVATLW
jgi:PIN domain nuclease of toxin-antitoxin system